MGFQNISELAHAMEDAFGRLKKKELPVTSDVVDLLFNCFDVLEKMIGFATKEGKEKQIDVSGLLKMLTEIKEAPSVSVEEMAKAEEAMKKNGKKNGTAKEGIGENTEEGKEGRVGKSFSEDVSIADRPETLRQVNFVKVNIKRLDKLMDLVGELLINKMQLQQKQEEVKSVAFDAHLKQLDRLVSDLQYEVMESRMVPVGQVFNRFPRMIRDLARRENKEIDFVMEGIEIELDRTVLDKIGEPLVHLLRNSVDHGIEEMEERKKANKSEKARIRLAARREKNSVILEVEDDGQGFNQEKIAQAALKKNIITKEQLNSLSPQKVFNLIFDPRFTTKEKVTEVSGRGVGLDVVKTVIEGLGGNVKIKSELGKGTTFELSLPLTLAIVRSFLIEVSGETYGIPIANVVRTVRIKHEDIKTIEGNETFILEEEDIPIFRLTNLFGLEEEEKENLTLVVVEKGEDKAALLVDKIVRDEELIIKPLDKSIKNVKGAAGATILGDGRVALIIDINTLLS